MPHVLSVGQCGFDQFSISRHLKSGFDAEVATADTASQAIAAIKNQQFDLVLVNRILDADGSSGLDLIEAIKTDPKLSHSAVMLVSNYPEAQGQAEILGALPGFGKADIRSSKVRQSLGLLLNPAVATPTDV